jgi:hypothetical protein
MPTKHTATDSAGRVHKRTSASRVYSHCVVINVAARPPTDMWPYGSAAYTRTEWASTLTNAQNTARRWTRNRDDVTVEIVPAQIVGGKS